MSRPEAAPSLDIDYVRAQFPAFEHPDSADWAFFENAGGAYAARPVVDRLARFMVAAKVQPYGPSDPSEETGREMDRSHVRFAEALGVPAETVMFGPSTSMNTYVLSMALRSMLAPGDEVIVTNQDHEANVGVWHRLAEGNSGFVVREWQVDPETGRLDTAGLDALLNERTRWVFVTHCSNLAGEIHDVRALAERAHAAGARIAVDGVSYAPHGLPNLAELGVDAYYFSLYKTFGPHQGLLYVAPELLAEMPNQGHFFNAASPGKRLTPAGPQHGEIACAGGVVDYLDALDRHHFAGSDAPLPERLARIKHLMAQHEAEQAERILALLREKGVRIIGPDHAEPHRRAATIAFKSDTVANNTISEHLRARQIACGVSDFYAVRLIEAMGMSAEDGVVRLSLVHYNSPSEVDRLLAALDDVL
ncbi:MAG: aminotransferase class V-fold PLP-dependent enzyme [Pseudomonadota bacterium]